MNDPIHIAGFSGSLRKGSYNTMLLKAVKSLLPDGMTMDILSIDMPLYNGDIDFPDQPQRPAPVTAFREAISKSDAVMIVSPEYNYSIPGGLKNAIDWASRGEDSPLIGKPASLMGATPGMWGTVRMHLAMLPIFQTLKMPHVSKPEIYLSQANKKFDENGNLTDDFTKELIKKHLHALNQVIEMSKS